MKLNTDSLVADNNSQQQSTSSNNVPASADLVRRFVALPLEKRRVFLEKLQQQGGDFSKLPIPAQLCGDEDIPLSLVQQGLWILHQLDPDSPAYHIAGGVRIGGALDVAALQQAFDGLAARHDALRSVFYAVDGQPRQRLLAPSPVMVGYHDLRDTDVDTAQRLARQHAEAAARQPFDLEHGPLWRVTLVRLPDSVAGAVHELSLTLHHLIADGWSLNRLLAEFAEFYAATLAGREPRLPTLPIRHADYAVWQRGWLEAGESQRQLAYWRARLGGETPSIELPYDRPRPSEPSQRGGRVVFALPDPLSQAIRHLAQQHRATAFTVLLAAFNALLYRYSGQTDLRIGLPLANRHRPESQHLVGYLVNTVVLRSDVRGDLPFSTLLAQTQHHLLEAQAHPDLPFEHLVDALQPERRLGQNPLFQILINHQQHDFTALQQHNGWQVDSLAHDHGTAQFDLSLDTAQDRHGQISGFFTYATDLFDAATIERLAWHYQHLLAQLVADPHLAIASPALQTPAEQAQSQTWNTYAKTYDGGTPVHELIRQCAARQPDAVALACGGQQLSYRELDRRANRLAHRLIGLGVRAETRVALLLPRGIDAIVAMLAVLKAGGAYLPLDPTQPPERLAGLLTDAGVGAIIACRSDGDGIDAAIFGGLAYGSCPVLDLDGLDLDGEPTTPPAMPVHPGQLAYLILTSGSTGRPKCVAVAHDALVRHCQAIAERYDMQQNDIALHFADFTFDAAMEQWLVPLINGCRLVIRDELWSAEQAYRTLLEQGVTWFEMPPAYLTEIARWAEQQGLTLPLRACSVGGEAVSKDSLAQIRRAIGDAPIVNGYGPTETLITPLVWIARPDTVCDTAYAPIGTGVGERTLYILDKDLNPLPSGVVGELYIGGPCLARGYDAQPSLTAGRFIPDPFDGDGGRLYRTGDLVRFRADGNIEYLGRSDHQIKLRGFRIELGEIEAQILSHPAITEAVVVADGEGNGKRLIAYAVNTLGLTADGLKQHLQSKLPDYMVPAQIIMLECLPRLASGKLDRRALPKPEWTASDNFRQPQTPAEWVLTEIWQEILGVGPVGIDDNFFELGGDSILSIRLVSRARQAGWLFTPRDLFLHQTVASLAAAVQPILKTETKAATVVGEVALTPIQAQFFGDEIPHRQHWNLSLLLQTRQPLDEAKLERVLQTLLNHHDSLRLRYRQEDGIWRQSYADIEAGQAMELLWRRTAQNGSDVESIANQAQRSLDLQNGPLLRAVSIRVADGSQRLLLVVHHLVVDGVSWRILLEDLQNLYSDNAQPAAKTASFKHWAGQLQHYARSDALSQQLPYWLAMAADDTPELPRDFPQDAGSFADAHTLSLRFSAETTRQLLQQAPVAYRTRINDLLLTALARVLCRWSGREQVRVELESHGREELFADTDLSRSVGWFTSLYPVCLPGLAEAGEAIKAVKEILRGVPDGGLGFGVLKYLAAPELRASLAALPQPKVSFNYFGQFEAKQALFAVAPETVGDDRDPAAPLPYWLEINAQVLDGELEIRWRYSEKQYRSATVQGLLDDYFNELTALVRHCLSGIKGATPTDFPLAGLSQPQLDALPLAIASVEDIYPLAPMQQGILFHALLAPETGVYVNQMILDIDGLDVGRFTAAWRKAIARHAIFRSAFIWRGETDSPLQVVYKKVALPLEIRDWRDHEDPDTDLAALAAEEHARGFDLAQAPLMRLLLVRLSEQRYRWIWNSHHILLDGWSTSQLLGEVLQSYAGIARNNSGSRYRDFIAWLQRQHPANSEDFWQQRLANLDGPTLLADALSRGGGAGHGNLRVRLDAAITQRLQAFAKCQRITLNTLLQGTWALLLQRYCGQNSVAFGVTVSGRPPELPDADKMLGLFINTLPLIVGSRPELGVGDWLRTVQDENLALREHEQTPLYDIQRWAGQAGAALFDSLLVFENFPVDAALRNTDASLQFGLPEHVDITHYPLTLNVSIGDSLGLAYGYWQDRFDADTVQQLDGHFRQLLSVIIEDAECPAANLHLLTEMEQRQLAAWNATATAYPPGLIHERISQRATAQPDAVALAFGGQTLAYGELERQANRLAHHLVSLGVGPETLVGIAMERSLALVMALLAVVKAGGAYVPLDPDYPAERLAYMAEDSRIGLLLSHTPVLQSHAHLSTLCRCLDVDSLDVAGQPDWPPAPVLHPHSPAYLIYTSGSTGRPKGATNSHAALANRLHWMQEAYPIGPGDTVLQKTPFSFDVSVWEFFWPLLAGARLAIAEPGAHRDPEALSQLLLRHRVSTLHFVPSMLAEFLGQPGLPIFPALKRLICSGEALSAELQGRVFRQLPGVELDNLYGPTEAAIDVTHWTCRDDGKPGVPIGRPIANTHIHILDPGLNPLPVGVSGELYIGGHGLARGYHRRPGLTAERFIPDPSGTGGRLYRTGDRARWRADGALEYLGRLDHQVKLRGLRIELGEIEAVLLTQEGVSEAAVLLKEGMGGGHLVAYLVADAGEGGKDALLQALRCRLPDYMLPAVMVYLDSLPKTTNGKLDRKALPDAAFSQQSYRAPQSISEQTLAALWQDLLGIAQVGLDDNFFELGGHSLLAMKLVGRIKQSVGVDMPVRRIFEIPQLVAMAAEMDALSVMPTTMPDVQAGVSDALAELQGLTAEDLRALLASGA